MGSAHSTIEDTSEKKNNNNSKKINNSNNSNNNNNNNSSDNIEENSNKDHWWPIENNDIILEQPNILLKTENNHSEKILCNINDIDNKILSENNLQINNNNNNNIKLLASNQINESIKILNFPKKKIEQTLEEFKEELNLKRMARSSAIDNLRNEIKNLKQELIEEKELNRKLRNDENLDELNQYDNKTCECKNDLIIAKDKINMLQSELAETQYYLQTANSDNLTKDSELDVVRKHVKSLKEVITCSKQMIEIKEEQVGQLKAKINEIEESLAERELKILSDDLRKEYDKQLANIRNLRELYEERARVCAAERENLQKQIQTKKDELTTETERNKELEKQILNIENNLQKSNDETEDLKKECKRHVYQYKELQEEMAVINKLFSQMLMGFNGTNCLDIDRLTIMLEENRTLLNEMATKEANYEGSSLPKLLFDIVKQVNNSTATNNNNNNIILEENNIKQNETMIKSNNINITNDTENEINEANITIKEFNENENENENKYFMENTLKSSVIKYFYSEDNGLNNNNNNNEKYNMEKVASAQEIIGNLPKVWKVLMELLNHHKIEKVEILENGQSDDCYKSVQTPNGPKSELSVSKTYIKLKDLILEKKSLLKETNRLKTLNNHLDFRLNEQEKRLSTVSLELTKTWHLVGKMQRQHRQLHTHEQILRYQLQQKRRLLNELKEELEYCRKKWQAARAKNTESQLQCDEMRKEFARRKLEDGNNSAESGYSDGPGSDEDETVQTENKVESVSYRNLFEKENNNRTIERIQSSSPTSAMLENPIARSHSVPNNIQILNEIINVVDDEQAEGAAGITILDENEIKPEIESILNGKILDPKKADRTIRIERLEEQCKSLIAQVLETSNCREKLEIQLCRFQDEMSPAQHPIPLDEFISKKTEKALEKSKTISRSCLTAREEEYTSRRNERLQRLEEESNQLMARIKRTNDRGNNMKTLVDNMHSICSDTREGSVDRTKDLTEGAVNNVTLESTEMNFLDADSISVLTQEEKDAINQRSERLKRLEEESRNLILKLTKNADRGKKINSRLDQLHSRYGSDDSDIEANGTSSSSDSENLSKQTIENRLKNMDEASSKRTERLRIMEEESKKLLNKLTKTSNRGSAMIKHLDENQKKKDEDNLRKEQEKIDLEISRQYIASSSIVPEQVTEIISITQTSTQIAQTRGVKPKVYKEPTGIAALQLCCNKKKKVVVKNVNEESLEEMFLRLTGGSSDSNSSDAGNSSNSSNNQEIPFDNNMEDNKDIEENEE